MWFVLSAGQVTASSNELRDDLLLEIPVVVVETVPKCQDTVTAKSS